MQPPTDQVISVKAFLGIINETLGFAFPAVTVEGEVSGFNAWRGKLAFFDIKEEDAVLNCMMPLGLLKQPIEDGMKIRVTGNPRLTGKGRFGFNVRELALAGEGELKRAFVLLKAKLEKEGLFAPERKRELPRFPKTIGLVTSGQSAAYADFMKILNSRWGGLTVQLADVQVQGAAAPDQIVGAINYFNQLPVPPDVLVIVRGGGSLEDLVAFNTEPVARAIATSRTPTLVGVGHEVDVSLADFAADRRAATPTNAAQLAVPDRREVLAGLDHSRRSMQGYLARHLDRYGHAVARHMVALERFVRLPRRTVEVLTSRLLLAQRQAVAAQRQKLAGLSRLLASFDPNATLKRGYAIARHDGQVVTKPSQVAAGKALMVQLAEGNLTTMVNNE